jgi:multicomponent Na+:H+ antiporter subunit D
VSWRSAAASNFQLIADALSLLFITLSAVLWLFTTVYAIGYLEGAPVPRALLRLLQPVRGRDDGHRHCRQPVHVLHLLRAADAVDLSAGRITGAPPTRCAARACTCATRSAAVAVLLAGIVLLEAPAARDFVAGGALGELARATALLQVVFWLLVAGIGVKAALVPLHGWLPVAMVAPAPVSALLHAVAVVKAGAFGIVRVVFDVYGVEFTRRAGLAVPLAVLAAVTILYGSLRALAQTDIKRGWPIPRSARCRTSCWASALGGPVAAIGGLVHLVHQGLMKITLFFCAGNWAETLNIKRIDQLDGVGRRMPWTTAAFTVGALGMIGVPPVAGFVSKWYLGAGAVQAGEPWVVAVLAASTLLNAAYFLPLLRRAWFAPPARRLAGAAAGAAAETRARCCGRRSSWRCSRWRRAVCGGRRSVRWTGPS